MIPSYHRAIITNTASSRTYHCRSTFDIFLSISFPQVWLLSEKIVFVTCGFSSTTVRQLLLLSLTEVTVFLHSSLQHLTPLRSRDSFCFFCSLWEQRRGEGRHKNDRYLHSFVTNAKTLVRTDHGIRATRSAIWTLLAPPLEQAHTASRTCRSRFPRGETSQLKRSKKYP